MHKGVFRGRAADVAEYLLPICNSILSFMKHVSLTDFSFFTSCIRRSQYDFLYMECMVSPAIRKRQRDNIS